MVISIAVHHFIINAMISEKCCSLVLLSRYEHIGTCKAVRKIKKEHNVHVIENLGDSCVLFTGSRTKTYGVRLFRKNFDCLWESGRVCGVDGKNYRSACHAARL